MSNDSFFTATSLIEFLEKGSPSDFPLKNTGKEYFERFKDLDCYFSNFTVEMGAMKSEIDNWREKLVRQLEDADTITDEEERCRKWKQILSEDNIIFLNKHGAEHIQKVQEKAFEILRCFNGDTPSYYETFLLLCAISVHDVGNMFGRTNHEKRIPRMLDSASKNIIDDTVERKVISRIAGVHGGSIKGNTDTISFLRENEIINNKNVREQMLASVLRFADELADDNSRANSPALETGILGSASEMFHVYSSKLHTVKLQKNPVTKAFDVVLKFEIDEDTAKKQFQKGARKQYLLDEIYERTFKMERERRYCMRFLRVYCSIEKVNVEIVIDDRESVFNEISIKYTLQEEGYPDSPYQSIKDVNNDIMTGEEIAQKLIERNGGDGNEYSC